MTANQYNQLIQRAKPVLCALATQEKPTNSQDARRVLLHQLITYDSDLISTIHVVMEIGRERLYAKGTAGAKVVRPEVCFNRMITCVGWCQENTKLDYIACILENTKLKQCILLGLKRLGLMTGSEKMPQYHVLIEQVKPVLKQLLKTSSTQSAVANKEVKRILNGCDMHTINTVTVIYYAARCLEQPQKHIVRENYFKDIVEEIGWSSGWSRHDRIQYLASKDNLITELKKGMQQLQITL